ncbi:hypothetical protein [Kitasatospora sp. GP82]|uniref:hypothetical protein n=1 Tax=Kitasatospora sp. GP82 TaxID=3035089 RepID=UPI002473A7D7|nr:hypothetical protein [Kitasatospora sp. GP82]MDH6126790.1 2-keto-3-deoxy-6-phosphogluconate aldolase [Kitasatospora sp. GP82]
MALDGLAADRVIAVVRAPAVPDAAALCAALAEGGIRWVEFTSTTPDVTTHLRRAVVTAADWAEVTRRAAEFTAAIAAAR